MFSVIIPARNEEKYLPACIESIKRQAGGFCIEIIVVNNGSTDGTKEIAESFGAKVIDVAEPGVGVARKIGTEAAQGDYILHVDADSRLPVNYLLEIQKRFNADSRLVCVGGQYYLYDANIFWYLARPILFYLLYWFSYLMLKRDVGPAANNMVFKKDVYCQAGGFNPNLKYGEDMDLNSRLCKFGRVWLDMKLRSDISSRRYNLFKKEFWIYTANFFTLCFRGKLYKNILPPA